jgi:hypothetical protein
MPAPPRSRIAARNGARFRPADVEGAAIDTVLGARSDQGVRIDRVEASFLRCKEACVDTDTVRTLGEHGGHRPPGADSPGGKNWYLRHGVENVAQQANRTKRAADMSARLDTLGDDNIAANIGSLEGLFARSNLPAGQRALIVNHSNKLDIRFGIEALDNPGRAKSIKSNPAPTDPPPDKLWDAVLSRACVAARSCRRSACLRLPDWYLAACMCATAIFPPPWMPDQLPRVTKLASLVRSRGTALEQPRKLMDVGHGTSL